MVDVGRSLVHDKDLRPLQDGPGEAKELPLTHLNNNRPTEAQNELLI